MRHSTLIYAVCARIHVRVCTCVQVCAFVCWNPTLFQFVYVVCSALLLLLTFMSVSHRCLKLLSPLLLILICDSHSIIAVAQQVCVGHFHACVDIPYAWVWCVCYDILNMKHVLRVLLLLLYCSKLRDMSGIKKSLSIVPVIAHRLK